MNSSYLSYIQRVTPIDTQSNHALTIVQLAGTEPRYPDMLPFALAFEKGMISITEKVEHGSVPELLAENKSELYVLLLEGEILLGAKQNRTLNSSILLKPKSSTVIPVSCIEQGRWSYKRKDFSPSDVFVSDRVRSVLKESVNMSVRAHMSFASDQGKVWGEVNECLSASRIDSRTDSFYDAYAGKSVDIDGRLHNFKKSDDAVGLVSFINGKLVACDLVPSPKMFSHYFEKFLRSSILDTLHVDMVQPKEGNNYQEKAVRFLSSLKEANLFESNSHGVGTDIRIESGKVIGSALVFDDTVIHSALFAR